MTVSFLTKGGNTAFLMVSFTVGFIVLYSRNFPQFFLLFLLKKLMYKHVFVIEISSRFWLYRHRRVNLLCLPA